jgi:IclR family pca regulon transcriptional regulator
MLAFDPPAAIEDLIRRTDIAPITANTTVDPSALRQELALVRSRGYALVEQEIEVGVRSLALPIFDRSQQVVAAVTALTSMSALTTEQLHADVQPLLRHVVDELEATLQAGRTTA